MSVVKIVPMPGPSGSGNGQGPQGPQGPAGTDGLSAYQIAVENGFEGTEQEWLDSLGGNADTGNFTFVDNEMTTDGEMSIGVNGMTGSINLSAYSGIELSFAEAPGAGLRFPDGTVQTTAYEPSENFIPLPDFLTYVLGREALPILNENFGWDAKGLWFGPTAVDDGPTYTSYPVFTSFNLNSTDKVFVTFNVNIEEECSDAGVCIFPSETVPNWSWGPDSTRIAAQFNCPSMEIRGIDYGSTGSFSVPGPGEYRIEFTYDPNLEEDNVKFECFALNDSVAIGSQTLTETLPPGDYRIGFASDNDIDEEGVDSPLNRTYISDLFISVNNDQVTYSDTLQNGNSGEPGNIADFVFDLVNDGSTTSRMTIHNHDMVIRTTRDDNQDADIDINSADDVWITANDTIELTSATDEIRIISGVNEQRWNFQPDGLITSSNNVVGIESLSDVDVKGRLKFEPNNGRALLQAYSNNQTATFTSGWDTASWTILDSQQSQLTLTNASSIISFMEDTGYQVDNLKISINGSMYGIYSGAGVGDGAITFYIQGLMPPEVEFILTQLQFQYAFSSRVDIDFDEGDLTIRTEDEMDIVLDAADDVIIRTQAGDVFVDSNGGAYLGTTASPNAQIATLGDLDSGPKTWTAPNDSLYSIYQAHGGVSVELSSKAFHIYEQAYVETTYVNVNYVELVVDNNTEFLLIPIYGGSAKNRGIKLNDGSYVHNVLNFFPVSPLKWGFELETNATFSTGSSYAIEMDYGAPPVLWWDASNLNIMPEGEEWKFRGAKIEYHAYSQDAGTIIGTIYIAADSGDKNTTHLEVSNGVSDLGSIQLWNRDGNEYELYAYRTDGNSDTLNIHWTGQVYFSPDREND